MLPCRTYEQIDTGPNNHVPVTVGFGMSKNGKLSGVNRMSFASPPMSCAYVVEVLPVMPLGTSMYMPDESRVTCTNEYLPPDRPVILA